MFEIASIAIVLGALCAHMSVSIAVLLCILVVLGVLLMITIGNRGILVAGYIALSSVLGFLVSSHHHASSSNAFGTRVVTATVMSVDRELDKEVLIVRDRENDIAIKITTSGIEVLPGDIVSAYGTVAVPEDFVTGVGKIFPYKAYLESKGIEGIIDRATVTLVHQGEWSITRTATIVRHRVADIFAQFVAFPMDGIIAGMVIGYQGGIPQDIQDLFRTTGVLHVLVLSGYNITLLAGCMLVLLRRAPFRLRAMLTIVMIIAIVLISGAGVASVRAGIMGSIALLSGIAVRTYTPLRALLIATLCFLILSPSTIWSDPGFHLSFLATLFMVLLLPKVTLWFSWIPEMRIVPVRELLVLALCMPLFMLPYTMYFSGIVPLATIPANIILALVTPLVMVLGTVLLVVSLITPVASIVGVVVSWIGSLLMTLLTLLSHLPQWNTPPLSWWGVVGIYTVLIATLFRRDITLYAVQLRSSLRHKPSSIV